MATGNEYSPLQYAFRGACNTINKFVPEVADAIVTVYLDEVMKLPDSQQEWREIATVFSKKWNFHNTLGAIDGKHVAIRCPPNAGSTYYNYKQFHSIILMALVDAGYKFIFVDIGANVLTTEYLRKVVYLRHLKLTVSTSLHQKPYPQLSNQFPTQL